MHIRRTRILIILLSIATLVLAGSSLSQATRRAVEPSQATVTLTAVAGAFAVGLPDSFQTLQALHLGDGYLIRMNAAGALQYPVGSSGQSVQRQGSAPERYAACASVQRTPDMTLVYGRLTVDGAPAPAGTVLEAVTPRGEVAGCTVVEQTGQYGIMQVYGADAEAGIPGFQAGEPMQWRIDGVTVAAAPLTWSGERELQPLDIGRDEPGEPGAGGDIYLPLVVG